MSEELDAIDTAIANAATSPVSVSVDGTSATSRSVDDLIKIRQHTAARQSAGANKIGFGIRMQKIVPGEGG